MNRKCEKILPGFSVRKPSKYHFHSQAGGRGGFSFSFIAGSKYYAIDLYIDTTDADQNENLLNQLEADRAQIEKEFGQKLNFDPIPEKRACRIRYVIGQGDVMKLDRNLIQATLIEHMTKFEKILKPRIQKLTLDFEDAA